MKGKVHIYVDNAATTKLDPLALEAMLPFLQNDYANPSALYSFGRKARVAVELARQKIAECIGATPQEIYFTSGGTESDNWAIKGTAHVLREEYNHIITSSIEHHAVLNVCAAMERDGFSVTYLPVDAMGIISAADLENAIMLKTMCVSVMLANNEIGTIQDIATLASVTHRHGLIFHTDAVQALGHIPVNVTDLDIDLLSASAHKFNGPKGVGFLFKRNAARLTSFFDGGYQEAGSRAGTENVAGIVGMASALKNNLIDLSTNMRKLNKMSTLFSMRIASQIPGAKFNGHPTQHLPGLVSLSLPDVSGESLLHMLDLKGIYVSTGAACNSKDTVISNVLKAIKLPASYSAGTLRVSFSKNNTDSDALTVADTIIDLYTKLHK